MIRTLERRTPEEVAEDMKKFTKQLTSEPGAKERCRDFLLSIGIITPSGRLAAPYRSSSYSNSENKSSRHYQ